MTELLVSSIEDAVVRLSTEKGPVSRIVVDSFSTTFLAHNTVNGYSQVDFRRPDNPTLRELSAVLNFHCNLDLSDRFYTGVYRDMIRVMNPRVDVLFARDGVLSRGDAEPDGGVASVTALPEPVVGCLRGPPGPGGLPREHVEAAGSLGSPTAPPAGYHTSSVEPTTESRPVRLVAFGDSNTYGEEIDLAELGRKDTSYRIARAFPNLLASELSIPGSINLGEPACSNAKILRTLCNFVSSNRHHLNRYFFVVSLTHPARKVFTLKNGGEYVFINGAAAMPPRIIKTLCMQAFVSENVLQMNQGINEELQHKCSVVSSFLRKVRCRFVIFPCWNFAASDEFFFHKDLGKEAAFYFGTHREKFGMADVTAHLPRGQYLHTLSQGHALFACELAGIVSARGLL